VKLLEGEEAIKFQVGGNEKETVEVKGGELKSLVEEIVSEIKAGEGAGIKKTEEAITGVSKSAAEFGAVQDRLQYIQSNQEIFSQNLAAANSSIKDVNMAEAMSQFTQDQILQQAGVAVLSQANSLPQAVLKLIG